ncbi:hypothetical protein AVEN_191910-1 [Araneus ventricosus]|uniref:Uncharacterized protein n=1 Tax=Araneus ventricosus TaxID=182803 RepID=A0A4Y2NU49_ARAVE|nr:hypothetical protein AVEN_191910-1 [Araneus ventricosus]
MAAKGTSKTCDLCRKSNKQVICGKSHKRLEIHREQLGSPHIPQAESVVDPANLSTSSRHALVIDVLKGLNIGLPYVQISSGQSGFLAHFRISVRIFKLSRFTQ